ncbi:MAG: hypothetical protein WBV82_32400 [Myxococcaceae bacterium]
MSSISLRPLVSNGVQPFASLFGERAPDASDVLVEIIVGISNFEEEGFAYAPLVFVATDLDDLLCTVRGSDPIFVGSGSNGRASARAALKSCAPLGEGRRWALFVLMTSSGYEYGLFRPEGSPLHSTSYEYFRRVRRSGPVIIGLARLRTGVVEVRASTGIGQFFDLSGSEEEAENPARFVTGFMSAVTRTVPENLQPQLEAFYYRIGLEILTGDHGSLAVVLAPGVEKPAFLSDGIWFKEPVDLTRWIHQDEEGATGDGSRALLAYAHLIRRMMVMDGITVFGPDGTVRAYSCFVRDPRAHVASAYVLGGARRRTYELLRSQLGQTLIGVLYRSQDGAVECESR